MKNNIQLRCDYNEVETSKRGKITVKKDCNSPTCPDSSANPANK